MTNKLETSEERLPRRLRVVVADDHDVVRQGVRALVDWEPDMRVVGEAVSGNEVRKVLRDLTLRGAPPNVVVMDVSMPDGNGIEATAKIRQDHPVVKVLIFSMHEERSYLRLLLETGAAGYVLKRSAATELIRAIRSVAQGNRYLDPAFAATTLPPVLRFGKATSRNRGIDKRAIITDREEGVLRLIAQGYALKEIAAQLEVSVKTVETHKARSMEKLELDGRAELVRYAVVQGWLIESGQERAEDFSSP